MADKNLNSITFPGLPDKYKVAQVADEYSSSATYAVGDIVNYLGTTYRCTTAISTAEAWTAGHWTAVKIADEVTDLKSAIDDTKNNLSTLNGVSVNVEKIEIDQSTITQASDRNVSLVVTGYNSFKLNGTASSTFTIPFDFGLLNIDSGATLYYLINRNDGIDSQDGVFVQLGWFESGDVPYQPSDKIEMFNTVVPYTYPNTAIKTRNYLRVGSGSTFNNTEFKIVVMRENIVNIQGISSNVSSVEKSIADNNIFPNIFKFDNSLQSGTYYGLSITRLSDTKIKINGTANANGTIQLSFGGYGLLGGTQHYRLVSNFDFFPNDTYIAFTYFSDGSAVSTTNKVFDLNNDVIFNFPVSDTLTSRDYLVFKNGSVFDNYEIEIVVTKDTQLKYQLTDFKNVFNKSVDSFLSENEVPVNIGKINISNNDIESAATNGVVITKVSENSFSLNGTSTQKIIINLDFDSVGNQGLIDIDYNPVYFLLKRSDGNNDAYDSYLHVDYYNSSDEAVGTSSVITRFNETVKHVYPSGAKKFRTYFVINNGSEFDNVTFKYVVLYATPLKDHLNQISKKVPYPMSDDLPEFGSSGQVLTSLGDGSTSWENPITPSQSEIKSAVESWIDSNPDEVASLIGGWYVTPEMFGAYGDNTHDDTDALIACFASDKPIFSSSKTYKTTRPIPLYGFRKIVNFYGNINYTGTESAFIFDETDTNVRLSDSYIFINEVRALNGECFLMKPKNGNSNYVAGVVFKFGYLASASNKNIFHVQCSDDGWFNEVTFEYGNWANGIQAFYAEALDVTSNDLHLIRFHYCHMEGVSNAIKVSLNNTPTCLLIDNCRMIEIGGKYLEITGTPKGSFRGATVMMPHEIPDNKIVTPNDVSVHIV